MAYTPIAKIEKFTSEKNDAQVWLNNIEKAIVANEWNDTRARTWPTYETEAVTTYLGHFHRNLCQIQAINTNYFTVAQILNQFICRLHSTAITNVRDFEAIKLEANYTQAVNLVMNRLSELNSKLKQFSDSINQKLEEYLTDNHAIYQPLQ
ncbi:hypothetical protein G9A89_020214 [Geosiphon pyriformis]|nr:hypothetical protein G9A89_020214 [Geosiphon pyriformis]